MPKLCRSLILAALSFSALAAEAPKPAPPPLNILRTNAPALTLTQYKGKIVVLALIHTGCSHCQQFTAVLNILSKEYTAKGVQFLECAFNEDALLSLPGFENQFHPSFPVGYTTPAAVNAFLHRTMLDTRPLYVPHLMVLDRAGRIQAEYPGEDPFFHTAENGLRSLLDGMLKAPATSAPPSHR